MKQNSVSSGNFNTASLSLTYNPSWVLLSNLIAVPLILKAISFFVVFTTIVIMSPALYVLLDCPQIPLIEIAPLLAIVHLPWLVDVKKLDVMKVPCCYLCQVIVGLTYTSVDMTCICAGVLNV